MAKQSTAVRAVKAAPLAAPMLSDMQYMKQQLALIQPAASSTESSWLDGVAIRIGAAPSVAIGFADTVKTSFQYHEAKRKGLI